MITMSSRLRFKQQVSHSLEVSVGTTNTANYKRALKTKGSISPWSQRSWLAFTFAPGMEPGFLI